MKHLDLKKTMAVYTTISLLFMALYPAWSWAVETSGYNELGQQVGLASLSSSMGSYESETGSLQLEVEQAGESTQVDFNIEEILPGLTGEPARTDMDGLYEDDDAITLGVSDTISQLSGEESMTGEAFRTIYDGIESSSRPNLEHDSVWEQTDPVITDIFNNEFSDCTTTTTTTTTSSTVHVPEYHNCERIYKAGECVATRIIDDAGYDENGEEFVIGHTEYSPAGCNVSDSFCQINGWDCLEVDNDRVLKEIVAFGFGNGGMTSCGPRCLDVFIGKVGDNYISGDCTIYEQTVYIEVKEAESIASAELQQAVYDDYMQVYLEGNKIWQGPNENFPPETSGACELGTSWNQTISVDVTDQFQTNGVKIFKVRLSVTGKGEAYTRMRLTFSRDNEPVIFTPELAQSEDLPLYDGDTMENVCWEAVAEPVCNYNVGAMDCYIDINGNEQCIDNEGNILNSCTEYEEDPGCDFIKSECTDGATGETGICYVYTDTYDCGTDVEITDTLVEEEVVCAGDYSCPEGNCIGTDAQLNTSFNAAAAALQAAQFAMQDMDCGDSGTEECHVFGGNPYECKIALGGWQDCCDQPVDVGMQQYMDMLMATQKLASAKTIMGAENPLYGGWTYISDGASTVLDSGVSTVTKAYDAVSGVVSTAWESIAGSAGDAALKGVGSTATEEATEFLATEVITQTIEELTAKLAMWVYDTFGATVTNMIFSGSGAFTASEVITEGGTVDGIAGNVGFGGTIGSIITFVGWIYLIYQIANIIVQLVYECEEEEFELASKRALKSCVYIGSYCASEGLGGCIEKREAYCCYESPLSRIIMEQARLQIPALSESQPFGEPEFPQCEGLTLEQLGMLDWSLIDLDEWLGILETTGHLPSTEDFDFSLDGLTGNGNELSTEEDRLDTYERTYNRLESEETTEETNQVIRQKLYESRPDLLSY